MENLERSGEKLKVNEPERQKREEQNSWQRAKDATLYNHTQLPSTQMVEPLIALGSQHKGSLFFCVCVFVFCFFLGGGVFFFVFFCIGSIPLRHTTNKGTAIPWPSCARPWTPETRWCWPHSRPQASIGPPGCPVGEAGSAATPSSPWTTAQYTLHRDNESVPFKSCLSAVHDLNRTIIKHCNIICLGV